jgi:ATP-binding cassette subfamily B protein
MPDADTNVLPLPPARDRIRALWSVLRLAYRADRRRALLALLPGWPLAAGAVAISGQSILGAHGADDVGRVVVAGAIAGAATMAAATIGYWQAANGLLRMAQVISTEVDDVLLGHFGAVPTLDPFDDPDRLDRLEILRVGRQPLVNVLAAAGGVTQTAVGSVVAAVLFATVRPWLAVLPLLVVPVAVVYFRTEEASSEAERRVAERRRVALHLYDVGTGSAEGKELRVLGQADALLARHDATWIEIDDELSAVATRGLVLRLLSWAAYCAVVAVALAVALRQASSAGDLEGSSVFVLGVAAGQLVFLAFGGAGVATGLRNASDIAGHLAAAVDRTDLATPPDRSDQAGQPAPTRIDRGIQLDGVTFRYQGRERDALGPIDLHLRAGTVTALVGPNGAGKSTLVNLLLGLRHPTTGTVRIDGIDLRQLTPSSWFERTSMVCQDFVRFELSVREGVGAGDLPRLDDPAAVQQALDRAEATSVLAMLPDGIETLVGTGVGGRDLSGGQWQRLAVARALMRDEPLLLVLDEPTVSMDAISEQRLLDRCIAGARRLATERGSVVVFVSHRYATARLADQIAVIDRGVVAELGTHAELVARDGQYANIYRRQADAYRR